MYIYKIYLISRKFDTTQELIAHAVMIRLSFSVLVAFSLEVLGHLRQVSYSFFDRTVTEGSFTFLYGTGSIFQCGGFCMEDGFCTEFLYNGEQSKCFGIHEENRKGYSYLNVIPNADKVQRFCKGKISRF